MSADFDNSSEDESWEILEKPLLNSFTFGWLEDGRCGIDLSNKGKMQLCPHPITTFEVPTKVRPGEPVYICKKVSAGSRHTLFLMIDCAKDINKKERTQEEIDKFGQYRHRRSRKVFITGLNQVGLCEEKGDITPMEITWQDSLHEERPIDITAGRGCSFILTKAGHIYSFGHGRYGLLGHQYHYESVLQPTPIPFFLTHRRKVIKVSTGGFHCLALTDHNTLFSWGRNQVGQLGLGFENNPSLPSLPAAEGQQQQQDRSQLEGINQPTLVSLSGNASTMKIIDIACGFLHCIIIMEKKVLTKKNKDGSTSILPSGKGAGSSKATITPGTAMFKSATASPSHHATAAAAGAATGDVTSHHSQSQHQSQQQQEFHRPLVSMSKEVALLPAEERVNSLREQGYQLVQEHLERQGLLPGQGMQHLSKKKKKKNGGNGGGGDEDDSDSDDDDGHGNGAAASSAKSLSSSLQKTAVKKSTATLSALTAATAKASSSSNADDDIETSYQCLVYAWGDESQGQLGSGDKEYRMRPQENRYVTKYNQQVLGLVRFSRVIAGGYHNLLLVRNSGQVISWGGNTYGQLGQGHQFAMDDQPKIINHLEKVVDISAGLRHSLCICESSDNVRDVLGWGYNAYGELGLSDTAIRLSPTRLTGIKNTKALQVSCGDRHSALVIHHVPLRAKDMNSLKPYFTVLEENHYARDVLRTLQYQLIRQGLDEKLLEYPNRIVRNQAGLSAHEPVKNDSFEKGLRYCLDTYSDPHDWRRKAVEACFECFTPTMHLKKVCLSCARNCLAHYRLRPYIRQRMKGDTCDCHYSGLCVSIWTPIRQEFDKVSGEDGYLGPRQIRALIKKLRTPFPVETADVDDCLSNLAEAVEDSDHPRIKPGPFEKWYKKFYDEENTGGKDDEGVK